MVLPADLQAAEAQALTSLQAALASVNRGRWTVDMRFEGLKLLPVALRLFTALSEAGHGLRMLFTDAGATALAQREAPEHAGALGSLQDQLKRQNSQREQDAPAEEGLLLVVAPSLAEYELFESLCNGCGGSVVVLNGRLEDAAVGIGSVARERRKGFLSTWQAAYALAPRYGGALRRSYPGPWELYRQDPDGYRLAAEFEQKPDQEQQDQALSSGEGLDVAGGLRALDQFIEGLRN